MQILTAVLFVATLAYGFIEFRRWKTPEMAALLGPPQRVRRIVTFVLLLLALAAAFGGTFFPKGRVSRHEALFELCYWLGEFIFAAIVGFFAVVEFRRSVRDVADRSAAIARDDAYQAMVETVAKVKENDIKREKLPQRNGHDT